MACLSEICKIADSYLKNTWDHHLPVNPFSIAYNAGIKIKFDGHALFGSSLESHDGNPVIVLSPYMSASQLVQHAFVNLGRMFLGKKADEVSLNQFFIEMSIPREKLMQRFEHGCRPSVLQLATEFGVDVLMMMNRLNELGLDIVSGNATEYAD